MPWSRACRTALAWCCNHPLLGRPLRSRSDAVYEATSPRPPFLAANECLRMALKVVLKHAHRPRGTAYLLQRAVQLLNLRGIRRRQISGIAEGAFRSGQ